MIHMSLSETCVLATRRSQLALCQTRMVCAHLESKLSSVTFSIKEMVTTGDRQQGWSLPEQGGKGLFTSELEQAVLRGEADLAVHSAKDLPTEMPDGLALAGFMPREKPHDVLVCREGIEVPSTLATGSPRRQAQISRLFPQCRFQEFRGNVETRLRKIAQGEAESTILAAAGLRRLGITSWPGLTFQPLDFQTMVPAPGQGAIAIQCRAEEAEHWAAWLDPNTFHAVTVERTFLHLLGGGCHSAFAAHLDQSTLYCFGERDGFHQFPWSPHPTKSIADHLRQTVPFLPPPQANP